MQLQPQKAYKQANNFFVYPIKCIALCIALCSSGKFVRIKRFKHHTFVFLFHLVQSANIEFLSMKTHRVLNGSSKCAVVFIFVPSINDKN